MKKVNKELRDLQTIVNNLPDEMPHFFVFTDDDGQILMGESEGQKIVETLSIMFGQLQEKKVHDENFNKFVAMTYGLLFGFAATEDIRTLEKVVGGLNEILKQRKINEK